MKATYAVTLAAGFLALSNVGAQQTPPDIITPDKVETRIGALDFKDGMPSKATLAKVAAERDRVGEVINQSNRSIKTQRNHETKGNAELETQTTN